MTIHGTIYGNAAWYDLAFSYRDYAAECAFIEAISRRHLARDPRTLLELAAGPGNHAIELARRGLKVTALDRTASMVAYGREKATREGVSLDYLCADMRRFELGRRYDAAACMMVSWTYLLDNDDVLRHLDSVADHLVDGGVLVVELEHPRRVLSHGASTQNVWEVKQNGRAVGVTWGQPDDPFDPISLVSEVTVEFRIEDDAGPRTFWEVSSQRAFTANEVLALIAASGRFEVVDVYGALDASIPFDNERAAWRMVPVLKKIA